jgi:HPt (histidine-containing phosphotransfer) domain-containing protein
VSAYVDSTRITQLKEFMGAEADPMIASMLRSLSGAIARLESVVEAGEVDAAAQVAHTARNDALMLGAGPLQEALRELEAAARDADEPGTSALLERVREVWPATWEQLQDL